LQSAPSYIFRLTEVVHAPDFAADLPLHQRSARSGSLGLIRSLLSSMFPFFYSSKEDLRITLKIT
jgi:hypothetical protein